MLKIRAFLTLIHLIFKLSLQENKKEELMRRYGAEFIGTFWLVLGGCGSAVLAVAFPDVGIGLLGGTDYRRCPWRDRVSPSRQ